MCGCESWTMKKAECWRIDAFELWCWRRLLRAPWTARRSNQSILKEISSGCSLEGLMLKLKLQYFGHLMQRDDSFEDPDAEKDWGHEEKGTIEDDMVGWQNWYFPTVMLEKTPENPLDNKEIKPVNLKGNQPWIHIGRTGAEAPVFWSSDANSWLIGKVPDARKDWGQKKRGTEDEMLGWHHQCNGHELGQTSGDGEGQRGLASCRPWCGKELDTTEQLNNNKVSLFKLQIAENPTSD